MEKTRTEYFCDQCGRKIVTEHDKHGLPIHTDVSHIRINTGQIMIQKPDTFRPMPTEEDVPENFDFCSIQCMGDFIETRWNEVWLDQINQERRQTGLVPFEIGPHGFLERVKDEPQADTKTNDHTEYFGQPDYA